MKHILVIGGGVVGLSTAYYCALKGHRVTVLDRSAAEHENCSYGNSGLIAPSHFVPLAAPGVIGLGLKWMLKRDSPFYIKPRLDGDLFRWLMKFWRAANHAHVRRSAPLLRDLNLASRSCYEELASLTGNSFGFEKRGLLCVCKSERRFEEEAETAEQATELGLHAEVLNARQAAALDPHIKMEIVGAVYFRDDCHLTPARFMAALKEQLAGLGVAMHWATPVTGIEHRQSRVISARTDRAEFQADEYVLCAGSWSSSIVRALDLNLPMQPGKGYNLTLVAPRQSPVIPAILTEARVAVTPMGSALRFGGTMEIAGLTEGINPVRVQGIINSVQRYYPQFVSDDFAGVEPWSGLRPCSPDGLPYVGRAAKYSNFAIASGHAMLGLSLGPITGKLMSEILSGETPSIETRLLSPDRFA